MLHIPVNQTIYFIFTNIGNFKIFNKLVKIPTSKLMNEGSFHQLVLQRLAKIPKLILVGEYLPMLYARDFANV